MVHNLFREMSYNDSTCISWKTVEQNITKFFQVAFRELWDCHICSLARTCPAICSFHSRWQNPIPWAGFSLLNLEPWILRHGPPHFLIINHWLWICKRQQTSTVLLAYVKCCPVNGLYILMTSKYPKASYEKILKDHVLICYCLQFEKPDVQIKCNEIYVMVSKSSLEV